MVLGYVVMRVALLAQWLRAASQSPDRRTVCLRYAATIVLSQVGWVALAIVRTSPRLFFGIAFLIIAVEVGGPLVSETRGVGTPWHAHHIAERYSLLAIIALGEGVVGSVVSLEAVTQANGWDLTAAAFVFASMGITFGLWWIYFAVPFGEILHHHRERGFVFGYGHMVLFGAIAAVGAGLHVVAYVIEAHHDPATYSWVTVTGPGAVTAVAVPVIVFLVTLVLIWRYLFRRNSVQHMAELVLTVAALGAAIALGRAHASLAVCLLVIALAPAVVVIGYEVGGGNENQLAALADQRAAHEDRRR